MYSGDEAEELFDLLEEQQEDVEAAMRRVTGFVSYTLFRTSDGGVSVTVCQDKAGTAESSQVAREWIEQNASDLDVSAPEVSEGEVLLHLS